MGILPMRPRGVSPLAFDAPGRAKMALLLTGKMPVLRESGMIDLREFLDWVQTDFEKRYRVGPEAGSYARRAGERRVHLYGIADMACVLYALHAMPCEEAARAQWVRGLQDLQDPRTGRFVADPPDHGWLHNTAFALGALNLLCALPRHPLGFARGLADRPSLDAFLDNLDWRAGVYRCSHDGAGLASALAMVPNTVEAEWFEWYFEYTDGKFAAASGLMGLDKPPAGDCDQIGGTFHYAFLYEYFGRPMPHPRARIDAVLGLQRASGYWDERNPLWLTLDAVYMLARAQCRIDHRRSDVISAVRRAAAAVHERIRDPQARAALRPHDVTAVTALFAECRQFLGADEVRTSLPLLAVLDRRPFI